MSTCLFVVLFQKAEMQMDTELYHRFRRLALIKLKWKSYCASITYLIYLFVIFGDQYFIELALYNVYVKCNNLFSPAYSMFHFNSNNNCSFPCGHYFTGQNEQSVPIDFPG